MCSSPVGGVASLDLFVELPDVLTTQPKSESWSGPQGGGEVKGEGEVGTTYLHQHELVEAAVHHQPQGAGCRLSAGALPASSLRLLPLLLFLRLLTLPLETPLLFPVLPFLPAQSELKVCETCFAAHARNKDNRKHRSETHCFYFWSLVTAQALFYCCQTRM